MRLQGEFDLLREQIALLKDERDDLRRRLDEETEERRMTQAKLTALLTHEREQDPEKPANGFRSRLAQWIAGNK